MTPLGGTRCGFNFSRRFIDEDEIPPCDTLRNVFLIQYERNKYVDYFAYAITIWKVVYILHEVIYWVKFLSPFGETYGDQTYLNVAAQGESASACALFRILRGKSPSRPRTRYRGTTCFVHSYLPFVKRG